jgi:nucleotide-binding universal stress UspA family protein
MVINKLLWPTDFSENAASALPYVTSLSQKYGTEIHVLYVMKEYGAWGAAYGDYEESDMEKMKQLEKQMAEKRLNDICQSFLHGCPLYVRHIAIGDPATEILKLIDKEKVDMVVMASKGQEGYFHFGSVAEKVLKCSPVPVVTIPLKSDESSSY